MACGESSMKPVMIVVLLCLATGAESYAGEISAIKRIKPEQMGEFVTLSGSVSEFTSPTLQNEPYGFILTDATGDKIRVVTWPDIFKHVKDRKRLETTGTVIEVTAEVAEYKGKMELHVQDYEEVKVGGNAAR